MDSCGVVEASHGERRLNYAEVAPRCACVRARERCVRVCVRARRCACNEMDPDMESHHTKRDNQIMIKTKQMAT